MLRFYSMLISISIFYSCNPDRDKPVNKFSDPVLVSIYQYKDRRLSDSLYLFFSSENPEYRREAALAFGSVQDSLSVFRIGKLLVREEDPSIRKAAAFAIGQTRSPHSERILLGALIKEKDADVLNEILQAYGKSTKHWQQVNPKLFHDTVKSEGLAWSIYRAGLNGNADSTANIVAAELLSMRYNEKTRLGAAHFFSRSASGFDIFFQTILDAATTDPSIHVRLATVHALRKIRTPASQAAIEKILDKGNDYRLRVNAARALQAFSFQETKTILFKSLRDKNINVSIAAAETIREKATADHWIELSNMAEGIQNWRTQATLYDAALKNSRNDLVAGEIKALIEKTRDNYQKAALIIALQHHYPSLPFLADKLSRTDVPVIATSASAAICGMNELEDFSPEKKYEFVEIARQAVEKGDPGVIGIFCSTLSNPKYNYRSVLKDIAFLKKARNKLELPEDNESIRPIEDAIAYFENRQPAKITNEYNHPIDWKYVKKIPSDQKMLIKTTRGNITVRLTVEDAPGSVENFMKLASSGYFNNRTFHRVVPNFVIQDGCKRGDGFGSEDYSIRSEFSHAVYKTGSLGMASAGKDTEGTQWFITHSPTPHLDGRYSIFGEVVDGIEAVHLMEVGDTILGVIPVR